MQVYKMHKTYTKNMCILPMDIHKKLVYNVIKIKKTEQRRVKTKWRKRTGDTNITPGKGKGIMRRSRNLR